MLCLVFACWLHFPSSNEKHLPCWRISPRVHRKTFELFKFLIRINPSKALGTLLWKFTQQIEHIYIYIAIVNVENLAGLIIQFETRRSKVKLYVAASDLLWMDGNPIEMYFAHSFSKTYRAVWVEETIKRQHSKTRCAVEFGDESVRLWYTDFLFHHN